MEKMKSSEQFMIWLVTIAITIFLYFVVI